MSNPNDPHTAPTVFPGGPPPQQPPPQPGQPAPTQPLPQQPPQPQQPQSPPPYPPYQAPGQQPGQYGGQQPPGQYPGQPGQPGGGYGQGPGGPGFGAPGGYGSPGFGGPPPGKSKLPLIIGGAVLALVLLIGAVIGGVVLLGGDDGDDETATDDTSQTEEPSESEEPSTADEPETSEAPSEPESSATPDQFDPNSDLTKIAGFYNGTYDCAQGETNLTLTIAPNSAADGLDAVFDFKPGPGGQGEAGSFLMEGTLTDGVLFLEGTDWIVQPDGYVLVNLQANVSDASTKTISGEVLDPGCSTFSVSR